MKFWSQRLTLIYSVDIKFSCFTTPPIRHHISVTKSFKRLGSQCIRVARVIRESREKMPRSLRSRTVLIFFSCILNDVRLKSLIRSFLANCTILNCESYHSVPHLLRQFSWHCSWAHTILSTSIFSLYDPRSFERYLKAMLNEAIFLATCNATNVALQVARKNSRVRPHFATAIVALRVARKVERHSTFRNVARQVAYV